MIRRMIGGTIKTLLAMLTFFGMLIYLIIGGGSGLMGSVVASGIVALGVYIFIGVLTGRRR